MFVPSVTFAFTQGAAIFGCTAVITAAALRSRSNQAAPYWITFSVALLGSWFALVFQQLGQDPKVVQIIGILFVMIAVCSLWAGIRIENDRTVKARWIPFIAVPTAMSALLSFLHPLFTVPSIALGALLIMGVLTIREAVTGRARFNLFTQAIAWSLTLGGIALLSAGFMVMVTNSIFLGGTRANPAGAVILTDLSRHFLVSVSLVCVAGLIARPIRRSLGPDTAHAFVDVPVGDVVNRVPAILNRAKAQHRDLALITVTIEDAFDFLNVFGQEGLDTVSQACVDVLRAQVSPLALVGELNHDQYFVLLETANVEATEALVAHLGQQLTTASLEFGGRFAFAGRFAYADTRVDGYDWDHLLAQAESRLQPGRPLSPAPPSA